MDNKIFMSRYDPGEDMQWEQYGGYMKRGKNMTILKTIIVIVIYDFLKIMIKSCLRIWREIDDFDDEDPEDEDLDAFDLEEDF